MAKILGLDLGTNSIGWAIRNTMTELQITHKGCRIFPKGVGEEKNNEFSLAAMRTDKRQSRRKYMRRKMRKARILKLLVLYGMCPLPEKALDAWTKYQKGKDFVYPTDEAFIEWLKINPYQARQAAIQNPSINLYHLGRAFYHMVQRRGYLSNRKDDKEKNGKVNQSIEKINDKKGEKTLGDFFATALKNGEKIRGVYTARKQYEIEFDRIVSTQQIEPSIVQSIKRELFFQRPLKSQKHTVGKCTLEKNKPRCAISHYAFEEFRMLQFLNSIKYKKAGTPDKDFIFLSHEHYELAKSKFFRKSDVSFPFEDITKEINKRSLKHNLQYDFNYPPQQKVMGCPTSAAFLNLFGSDWLQLAINYKKTDGKDGNMTINDIWHSLFNFEHNDKLLAFAKDRLSLNDEDAKKLTLIRLKQGYAALSLKAIYKILPFLRQKMLYSHAVFLANVPFLLGNDFWQTHQHRITEDIVNIIDSDKQQKRVVEITNNLIANFRREYCNAHPDYTLDDTDKQEVTQAIITELGITKWQSKSEAEQATLINKVTCLYEVQLRKGFSKGQFVKSEPLASKIQQFLKDNFSIKKPKAALYHPSAIETYPKAKPSKKDGISYLGSPRTSSVRNPMAMRTLHELRYLINELLQDEQIDSDTEIVVELARELNDKNMRKAIQNYQKEREDENETYRKEIKQIFKEQCNADIEPTENEIKKFRLWKEQEGHCMYTGLQIGICDFIGGNPLFDISHTWPRSQSFDNSLQNITLGHMVYNRVVQGTLLPSKLPNYDTEKKLNGLNCHSITPLLSIWEDNVEEFSGKYERAKYIAKIASDKESRDKAIQSKHYYKMHLDYWREKLYRFTAKEIRTSFKNSQLRDTSLITRLANQYLKTIFDKRRVVKGSITAEFRKIWGLQENYTTKQRDSHLHHTIDAIVLTFIDRDAYDKLAHYYYEEEQFGMGAQKNKPSFAMPMAGFVAQVNQLTEEVLVSHGNKNNMPKATYKKMRKNGLIQYQTATEKDAHGDTVLDKKGKPKTIFVLDEQGKKIPLYLQGDSARKSLHMDTYYGAIQRPKTDKNGSILKDENGKVLSTIQYVVRRSIADLKETDIKNIVDDTIRSMVQQQGLKGVQDKGLFLPNKNGGSIPIKKIRMFANDVKNPILLKKHTYLSKKDWKTHYHVKNESNYLLALYEGHNPKGKIERGFEIINTLEAAQLFASNQNERELVPMQNIKNFGDKDEYSLSLKQIFKIGGKVILLEKEGENIEWNDIENIKQRLYIIKGLSSTTIQNKYKYEYGSISLIYHSEARRVSDLKQLGGEFKLGDFKAKPFRSLYHTQIHCLLENQDFIMKSNGDIIPTK